MKLLLIPVYLSVIVACIALYSTASPVLGVYIAGVLGYAILKG